MIKDVINRLNLELTDIFSQLYAWLIKEDELLNYKPESGGWTIAEVLEHVSITNHYLLILISKGTKKAIQKATSSDLSEIGSHYELDWQALKKIGEHDSFIWNRPEHMEPTRSLSMDDVKKRLENQMQQTLGYLQQMQNGEGSLYKTTMTVNNLGKIDVYHYIYFLVQHAKRHVTQMQKIEMEFETKNDASNKC